MPDHLIFWLAIASSAVCFGGLAYVLVRAFAEGAGNYADNTSNATSRQLEDLFLFIPPKRIAEASWALATIAFLFFGLAFFNIDKPLLTLFGLAVGVVAGFGAFQIPRQILAFLRDRRRRRFNEQLVDALGQISNALKAGFSITQGFDAVVKNGEDPISQEFEIFLQQQRVGVSFSDALENLQRRVGSEDLELVCSAMEISRRTGGNLTEVFDKIALTIRERMRIERRVMSLTAQGRMQGIIVGALPFAVGVGMAVYRPDLMGPFLHSAAGMASIAAVLVLITLGALVIRKIIKIDV